MATAIGPFFCFAPCQSLLQLAGEIYLRRKQIHVINSQNFFQEAKHFIENVSFILLKLN